VKKLLLLAVVALLLFGCLEREDGLDKWSPAGSTAQPNRDIFNTPTPQASLPPGASIAPSPSANASAHPSASVAAPSPTPQVVVNCTISAAPGSDSKQLQIIVKFNSSVSATLKCWLSAPAQSLSLAQGASGTYNGFATCSYSAAGHFTVSASGGGASCEKEVTIS